MEGMSFSRRRAWHDSLICLGNRKLELLKTLQGIVDGIFGHFFGFFQSIAFRRDLQCRNMRIKAAPFRRLINDRVFSKDHDFTPVRAAAGTNQTLVYYTKLTEGLVA